MDIEFMKEQLAYDFLEYGEIHGYTKDDFFGWIYDKDSRAQEYEKLIIEFAKGSPSDGHKLNSFVNSLVDEFVDYVIESLKKD